MIELFWQLSILAILLFGSSLYITIKTERIEYVNSGILLGFFLICLWSLIVFCVTSFILLGEIITK